MKKIITSFVLLFLSFGFSFLIVEGSFRAFVDESKYIMKIEAFSDGAEANEKNGLRYKNGELDKEFYLRPNSNIKKNTDKLRIALIGDSYTQGTGVNKREHEYDYQLQKMLNEDENFPEAQVIKFAGDPFNSFQEFIVMKDLVLDYHPDIIVLQFCANDGQITRIHVGNNKNKLIFANVSYIIDSNKLIPSFDFLESKLNKKILSHSCFLRFLAYRLNFSKIKDANKSNYPKSLSSIAKMKNLAEENGIPFFIVNFPIICENFCSEEISGGIKNKVIKLSKKEGIPFYDLCNNIDPKIHNSEIDDFGHYNKKGYNVAAAKIKQILEELYLSKKNE